MKKKKSKVTICDELWALAVKKQAGWKCEVCGRTPTNDNGTILLQSHHMIPRTNYSTRFMLENGVCFCYKDHIHFAHKDALGFGDWFRGARKEDETRIEFMRHSQVKNDYVELEKTLGEMI